MLSKVQHALSLFCISSCAVSYTVHRVVEKNKNNYRSSAVKEKLALDVHDLPLRPKDEEKGETLADLVSSQFILTLSSRMKTKCRHTFTCGV